MTCSLRLSSSIAFTCTLTCSHYVHSFSSHFSPSLCIALLSLCQAIAEANTIFQAITGRSITLSRVEGGIKTFSPLTNPLSDTLNGLYLYPQLGFYFAANPAFQQADVLVYMTGKSVTNGSPSVGALCKKTKSVAIVSGTTMISQKLAHSIAVLLGAK